MNHHQREAEAARLTELTGRHVHFRTVDCPCDYYPFCETCCGDGRYFEAVYTSCGHPLKDDDRDEECWENESCRPNSHQTPTGPHSGLKPAPYKPRPTCNLNTTRPPDHLTLSPRN